ncbi:hypothetical protein [Phormidesmis priestleyi]
MIPSLQLPEKIRGRSIALTNQNLGLLAVLLGATIVVVLAYVQSEHTFYWWDYTTYSRILDRKFAEFHTSPLQALRTTWRSAGSDYSDYPILLLLPFRWAFGNARSVYILSIALVYLLPFVWVLGTIATQLIPAAPAKTIRWLTALMAIATPVFWAPTLRGYVDVGGALLMALATSIYLRDVTLRSRWQIVAIGVLIGFAPLFRRHYAYAGIVFFVAMILQTIIPLWGENVRLALRTIVQKGLRIGGVAIVSLTTLLIFGKHFISVVLHNDFSSLYTAYEVSLSQGLQYYGISYGWVVWFLAALGFTIGFKKRFFSHSAVSFILLFYGLLLLLWVNKVRQVGVHYTTHFTALIILGLVALSWAIFQSRFRLISLGLLGVFLCANFWIGLAPVDALDRTPFRPTRMSMSLLPEVVGTQISELFAANNPPLRRSDYDEFAHLVQTLRQLAPQKQPIYIGGASAILNSNLMGFAEEALYRERSLNLLVTEDVDSRDRYPIPQLLQADYLAIATPFQHQIRPTDQKVVKVVGDIFDQRWPLSEDFTKLPQTFQLSNNVTVNLYQRTQSTSLSTVLDALDRMKSAIEPRPGQQLDWITTDKTPGFDLWREKGVNSLRSRPNATSSTTFLWINPLSDRLNVSGRITYEDPQCLGIELEVSAIEATAKPIQTLKLDHSPASPAEFSLPLSSKNADYLTLELRPKSLVPSNLKRCIVNISPLQVSSN